MAILLGKMVIFPRENDDFTRENDDFTRENGDFMGFTLW